MRTPIALLTLSVASLCVAACSTTPPPAEENKPAAEASATKPEDLVVVPLQFAPADEIAHVLSNSVNPHKVRIQPYARTNSLILVGAAADIEAVKQLIAKLDVQAK
jgi:type II secretory pathway component GspD/PulD (secretin)